MIFNEVVDDDVLNEVKKKKIINKLLILKVIFISVIAFFTSPVSLSNGIMPVPYVMIAVGSVFNIPLLIIAVISSLSMFLFGGSISAIVAFLITFVLFTFITSMLNVNGLTVKYSVLIKLFISMVIVESVKILFLGDSLFNGLLLLVTTALIYLVYVYGTSVFLNIRKGYVFTEEENIAAICMIAFILSIFSNFQLYGIKLSNIFLIMIVLLYGYRKGAILGCTSGFILGLIMSVLSEESVYFIITLSLGGLISGFMNKIGKIPTIIGFLVGSFIIGYFISGFAYSTVTSLEIIIASIPILFFPSKLKVRLEEFFNINNSLDKPYENLLESEKEVSKKIDAISSIISDFSNYDIENSVEDKMEFRDILKKYILEYIREVEIKGFRNISQIEREKIEICADYLSNKLEQNDEITESMIMFECDNKKKFIENIKDIYNSIKIMRILRRKEEEMQKNANNEYKKISEIIADLSKETSKNSLVNKKDVKMIRDELRLLGYVVYEDELIIEKDYVEYTFITDILSDIDNQKKEIVSAVSNILDKNMKIRLLLNISKTEKSKIKLASVTEYFVDSAFMQENKENENVCGDSFITMNFGINKYISALSDGAGSGENASISSKRVINSIEKLINAGFDETKAYEIINKIINLKEDGTSYASLDIAIINMETADANFIKFGAAPTYILSEEKVLTISSMNLPVGIISENDYVPIVKKLNNDDIIVQISDGVIASENNIYDNYFTKAMQNINLSCSASDIAKSLMMEVLAQKGKSKDDITILVNKIKASKSIN